MIRGPRSRPWRQAANEMVEARTLWTTGQVREPRTPATRGMQAMREMQGTRASRSTPPDGRRLRATTDRPTHRGSMRRRLLRRARRLLRVMPAHRPRRTNPKIAKTSIHANAARIPAYILATTASAPSRDAAIVALNATMAAGDVTIAATAIRAKTAGPASSRPDSFGVHAARPTRVVRISEVRGSLASRGSLTSKRDASAAGPAMLRPAERDRSSFAIPSCRRRPDPA